MRRAFVDTLLDLARRDPRILLVTGDLGFGALDAFARECPQQYLHAGVAEQNMTGIATGLALAGRIVFTYSIANFPSLRCLEQIRNDAILHDAHVKIVSVGAGLGYGASGMSHHAIEDLAILRALPRIAIFSPGDPIEAEWAVREAYRRPGVCYLRLGKGGEPAVHDAPLTLEPGVLAPLIETGETAILASGPILATAHAAARALRAQGQPTRLYSLPAIKPLNAPCLQRLAREVRLIITVEEHRLAGGIGSAVAEILAELPEPRARLARVGIPEDAWILSGSQDYLRRRHHLAVEDIVAATTRAAPFPVIQNPQP